MNIRRFPYGFLALLAMAMLAQATAAQQFEVQSWGGTSFALSSRNAAGDLDGDGDPDLVIASSLQGLFWFENQAGHQTTIQRTIEASTPLDGFERVAVADLNNDGLDDVIATPYQEEGIRWYPNLGFGAFGTPLNVSTYDTGQVIAVVDMDGDGDTDVVSASRASGAITWHEHYSNLIGLGPVFLPNAIATGAGIVTTLYVCDLDGDGDLDVVYAAAESGVHWIERTGQLSFGTSQLLFPVTFSWHIPPLIATPDLDGDGALDLLYALQPTTLAWRRNLGAGSFSPESVISGTALSPRSVFAVDIDLDGDMDPVVHGYGGMRWHENLGSGAFGAQNVLSGPQGHAIPTDVDADGDTDLMFTAGFYRNLTINNPPLASCPGAACLSIDGDVRPGALATMVLFSPGPSAPCYVFASGGTDQYPLLTIGGTTYYGHLDLATGLTPLADPSGTFGPSLTQPFTDSNGGWSLTVSVPDNPALSGGRFYVEAFVEDSSLLPAGLFHQADVLTVVIQ